ncbi:MAG TPA: hypothetical protein VKU00_03770, partial [Chthonomonadaceae bacterium]|nr:hypothetical protein [Chthonomonadaceae bacterium]
ALLGLIPWNFDPDVRALIRTGNVAYEMVRPLDLYTHWYCRAIAQRVAPTLLRCVPIFLLAGICFGMKAPPSLASGCAWALTTLAAILLNAAFMNLVTISLLWTLSGEGIIRAAPSVVLVFSGMLVPISFFPNGLQPLLNFLPFRDMVDVPFRTWLGQIPPTQIAPYIGHQLLWAGLLILVGRGLLARGTRRLVVEGG